MLLVGTLMSIARLDVQGHRADQRLLACRAAEQLLDEWFSGDTSFPTQNSGEVVQSEGLVWHTTILETQEVALTRIHKVRLTINEGIAKTDSQPLCVVDVLVSDEFGLR
jgi:hypothetical protein